MLTGETFIDGKLRDEIRAKFEPLCVDMETASVAHACYVNGIPYIAVRTITDTAEDGGQDAFERNCDRASRISAEVVRCVLRELAASRAGE